MNLLQLLGRLLGKTTKMPQSKKAAEAPRATESGASPTTPRSTFKCQMFPDARCKTWPYHAV